MPSLLDLIGQRLKANSQPRLLSFVLRLSRFTSHVLLLTFFFALPAFSQQTWERIYFAKSADMGFSVQQTTDGGYIVAGETKDTLTDSDVFLIKTDSSGYALWTRSYGVGARWEWGNSVQQTTDGGYIIVGYTWASSSDNGLYIIKTDTNGDTLWTRTYRESEFDDGFSVQQTTDGGYIVAGETNDSVNGRQVWLIKTNASGDTLWTKTYGGTGLDWGYSVQQTSDGGYIVSGTFDQEGSNPQVYLIKTYSSGGIFWTKTYYGGSGGDYGYAVQQTSDGGYIVAGTTASFGNSNQVYIIKTNALGDTLWTRKYGGTNWDGSTSIRQTSDGGYITAGITRSFGHGGADVYLIKTNANGDTLWTRTFGGTNDDGGQSVQQTSDGGYIVAGWTDSFGRVRKVYLIKTDSLGYVGVEGLPSRESRIADYRIFPNPFVTYTSVPGHSSERFALYNISGRKVGVFKGDRIGEGLSAGVYFLRPEGKDAKPLRIVKVR